MKASVILLFLSVAIISCKDDETESVSLVGAWHGDYVDVDVMYGVIPVFSETDDDFNVTLEFREDGTAEFTRHKDGSSTTGTYSRNGNKLTTDLDLQVFEIEGASTFDIIELTNTKLRLKINEKRTVNVPDFGNAEVNIRGAFHFTRP